MNLEQMQQKYAYTLAKVGLNVQPGQPVLVEAAVEGYSFVPYFKEACYSLGASNVVVHYLDVAGMKADALYRSDADVRAVADWEALGATTYLEQGACFIRLEGVNPAAMDGLTEAQASAVFSHIDAVRNISRAASRERRCQWLIAMVPTRTWADLILPDVPESGRLTALWKLILDLCYIDETNDVVKTWEEKNLRKQARAEALDALHLTKLHYTASNGTDLTVTLAPESAFSFKRPADAVRFNPNIPTEEICTTPEKFGTDGVVYATRPLVLGGRAISDFGFRFENGKVTEVLAAEGRQMLEDLVRTDENAGYLGECALVEYHSPISMSGRVYYTTLIDENASCHLALGRGLSPKQPDTPGFTFNNSTIHIDFMVGTPDMHIVGTTESGEEIDVFTDGDFAPGLFRS